MTAASGIPRAVPPQPAIAWFLRDLVPDRLWNEFDLGRARTGQIADVQRRLVEQGGARAWLECVEQTRAALPELLSISIFDALSLKLNGRPVLPPAITVSCAPVLSVFAAGRLVAPKIDLDCTARFAFLHAGSPTSGGYALVHSELTIGHGGRFLLERVAGRFFVPV